MKLSVAMCTYNGAEFIEEQLISILNQTVKIDEIIICDDCSTDDTLEILEKIIEQNNSVITIFRNEVNLRSNKNFEKALSLCTGDYIFFSDQDDIWKKNKVQKFIDKFNEDETIEALFSDGDLINKNSEVYPNSSLWRSVSFFDDLVTKKSNINYLIKYKSNMVTGATMCIKKVVVDKVLPIPDLQNYYHDEWIALIISSENKLAFLAEKLISYRIHEAQQTGDAILFSQKKIAKNYTLFSNILKIANAKKYLDIKRLSNNYHNNYTKYKNIYDQKINCEQIDFKLVVQQNLNSFLETEKYLKSKYPFLHFFRHTFDNLKGKRKI